MPNTMTGPALGRATVRAFAPDDVWQVTPQADQVVEYHEYFADTRTQALIAAGQAWTAVRADGSLMGCAGLLPDAPGTAQVWSIIDASVTGIEFMRAHCLVRQYLNAAMAEYDSVRFFADTSFPQAVRWAGLLGFTLEGVYLRLVPSKRKFAVFTRKGVV